MGAFANTMQTASNILATITVTFYSGSFEDVAAAREMQRGGLLHFEENLDDIAICVTHRSYRYSDSFS